MAGAVLAGLVYRGIFEARPEPDITGSTESGRSELTRDWRPYVPHRYSLTRRQ
jgi:hypothetical protein